MRYLFLSLSCVIFLFTNAQPSKKKPLNHSVYDSWKNIENVRISKDAHWISYELNPQKGDGQLMLYNTHTGNTDSIARGFDAKFSPGSNILVFKIKPQFDTIRQMKLKKVKKEKMPKDSLGIWFLANDSLLSFPDVKSFKMPREKNDWLAFLQKHREAKADSTESNDSTKVKAKKKANQKQYDLHILHPAGGESFTFESTEEYSFSKNGESLVFIRSLNDSIDSTAVILFETTSMKTRNVFSGIGKAKKARLNDSGDMLGFIFSADTGDVKIYDLYHWEDDEVEKLIPSDHSFLPPNWSVSEHGNISFSEDNRRMYFGIAPSPEPEPEDTLTKEEKVSIDIWNWKDPLLQSHQLKRLKRERERNYLSVYHLKNDRVIMLEDTLVRNVNVHLKSKGEYAMGKTKVPYLKQISWNAANYHDVYVIDQASGEKKKVLKKVQSRSIFSPGENYILWYAATDSSWNVYDITKDNFHCLSCGMETNFYDEEFDLAYEPNSYGIAGWTENDEYVLIYDRYDIWKFDPDGKEQAQKLTNGRANEMRFRYVKTDPEARFIKMDDSLLLSAFNEKTKASGYYYFYPENKELEKQILQDYRFTGLKKAKDANTFVYAKESFEKFPDLWISDLNFRNTKQITHANPQQKHYKWGTAELIEWTSLDGRPLEGILYKPEDFDPGKKYPMIVYFYETYSDRLHRHYEPKPSRSVINFSYYVSNDYLIFIPDIKYTTGYPGQSAYDAIMSGTMKLLEEPWVNEDKLGIQGQSWGGYQVAYLVTQTDLFAAAEAGAPVSNMTSAYGGIRWGSGMSRMFQYEDSQSRIGGTLWEKPWHYIQNSPLFMAPDINTPLLIMHNDKDGAVPWYQGIELFVALRRLDKPAWMLTYNGAPHNLKRRADMEDLTKRMQQFFDHYLKDKPAPRWMLEGIPAIQKGKEFGFELMEGKE
ncbi:MAG: prolyl oligopeptidase family serine peptidase [Bacteroidales bacterium]|nr:prolyl oligopeptidase family serine peptidase [Bacteroidales bacterium]MCF8396918.1 prolyl oligopeptidase family serine peptidase [Bacteroidales bacterium]